MDLIACISELLDERGWSKYQLAKEADLSQSTISSMMKRGNNPTVSRTAGCKTWIVFNLQASHTPE